MMLQKIEYAGIVCSVFPHKDIQTRTHLPDQDPEVVTYAAWRWLYHCRPLRKPLCVLCLGFRRNTLRRKSMRLALTLPARAAQLTEGGYLHLLVRLSAEGACLEAVQQSAAARPDGLPHRGRSIRFHA